jgi:hypothetical protein
MSDDNNSDHEAVRDHALNFIKTGVRSSADELSGAALGFARGGLAGGLAGAFLMPIAEGAGHAVAKMVGLEKSDEDR